jgi:hypothetical protein
MANAVTIDIDTDYPGSLQTKRIYRGEPCANLALADGHGSLLARLRLKKA